MTNTNDSRSPSYETLAALADVREMADKTTRSPTNETRCALVDVRVMVWSIGRESCQ